MSFLSQINLLINQPEQIILVGALSLIMGSFISLVTYRLNRSEEKISLVNLLKKVNSDIIFSRSECPKCHKSLKIRNLIPLFSWLFQKGKCSACKAAISARYPIIEAIFLISFLLIYFVNSSAAPHAISSIMLFQFAIATILITMCVYDLEHYFIPNLLQYLLAIIVTIMLLHQGGITNVTGNIKACFAYLACGVAVLMFFYLTTSLQGIGEDDLKFFFVAGLMLGMKNLLLFMMLTGLIGTLFGALWQKLKNDESFPFAPAICAAALLCLLFGKQIDVITAIGGIMF